MQSALSFCAVFETLESRWLLSQSTLYPTDDAYVRDGTYANTNYGSDTQLIIKNDSSANYSRRTFLKFDLSDMDDVTDAKIRLFGDSASSTQLPIVSLGAASATWNESTITWNNQPAETSPVLATTPVATGTDQWYEWNVSEYVQQERAAGRDSVAFVLKGDVTSTTQFTFQSAEAASNKAELLVTTSDTLAAPTQLVASGVALFRVALSWNDLSVNETGFKIERKTGSGGTWSQIATVGANVTSYNDDSVSGGSDPFFYRVRATDGGAVNSSYSNVSSALAQPSHTATYFAVDDTYVRDGGSYDYSNFGSDNPLWVKKHNVGYTRQTYLKFPISDIHPVDPISSVKVRLYGSASASQASLPVAIHSVSDASWAEGAVTWNNKPAGSQSALTSVTVSGTSKQWYEFDVTSYVAQQRDAGADYVAFLLKGVNTDANQVTFDSEEDALEPPELRVVTAPVAVNAPSDLTATSISSSSVTLAWDDNSNNETAFELQRKTASEGQWEDLDTEIDPNTTSYTDNTVEADEEYIYRIRATAGGSTPSPYPSAFAVSTEQPTPPQVLVSNYLIDTASHRISIQFNEDVSQSLADEDDLTVQNVADGNPISATLEGDWWNTQTLTATFTLPGVLETGNYRAVLDAQDVTDSAGTPLASDHTFDFYFKLGDADHDRDVDLSDLGQLATYYGQTGGAIYAQGDFDYDGDVDLNDLGTLSTYYGGALAAPPDLDLFEDANLDGIHDNSEAAERIESTEPTPLTLRSYGAPTKLALVLDGVQGDETLSFGFDPTQQQLYYDAAGTQPIPANTSLALSNFGLSGPGTAVVYGSALVDGPLMGGLSMSLSGMAQGLSALVGGTIAFAGDGTGATGGVEDQDGSQLLTNRDNFAFNNNTKFLLVGFAGHTQSLGKDGQGRVWDVNENSGVYKFAQKAKNSNFATTVFPEDPGNDNALEIEFCGDGVLGYESRDNGARTGGAYAFIKKAVIDGKVTKLGLFGYSHGGGAVNLLTQLLVRTATNGDTLHDPDFAARFQGVIWTGYIDAVKLDYFPNLGPLGNARGNTAPENTVPLTPHHFNVYQASTEFGEPHGGPMTNDPNPIHADIQRDEQLDEGDPHSLYHWNKPAKGQPGIEFHSAVQDGPGINDSMWDKFFAAYDTES